MFDASRHAVCVEPQTAPPDAIGHPALRPAQQWARELTFRVSAAALASG